MLTTATAEPTLRVEELGYTVMAVALVQVQLAVEAPVKESTAEQANWLDKPALFVAEVNETKTLVPSLLNTAELSIGVPGTTIPAASVACTVGTALGLAVGFALGGAVGAADGLAEGL